MTVLSLAGKKAVVTGASGGIGFAIASRFAQEGASVVLAGRTRAKLERSLGELQKLGEPPGSDRSSQLHRIHCLDVGEMKEWEGLVKEHKEIDFLVNCAGQSQHSLFLRTNEEAAQSLLSTNLRSVIFGCKTVAKQMAARRAGGCIVNVSSLLAYKAAIGTSIYAATKAGQLGLTTALSRELAQHGIRVNAVVPGYIDTDMTESLANKTELEKKIPLGRFGTASEVADAVAFLAKNEYANNCILNLDGGLSAV
ncbi:hypothetical protein MYCTH_2311736 [Thermothelomyces thermophilus ATCC 42464]|uniref:Uncharacterized protein n=1 Tax=Thermothelomyces thermophilus (strain ATCC 42464 / BCRC 31852 / DSM 1799) TaxID=573729 RepID=G2QPK3_THET4|nr:uncharacterized protein MYCTH_2311736 [Thermothelomyces thermophilus ATCC 42464]AEO61516.1 hypothetical protein MYCTH_2311736 [Thermothelomyces thermophilus ATCC 42464]